MRILAMLIVGLVFVRAAWAEELKTFKDWVVGCDNLKTCTALGLPPSDVDPFAYVKIVRGGEATAEPSVEFVAYAGGDTPPSDARLALAFDDPTFSGLSFLPTTNDGSSVRAVLPGAAVRDFISALNKANRLTLTIVGSDGETAGNAQPGIVSLSGASASLLYMDDIQGRVGTATALRSPGDIDASVIPMPPAEPTVAGVKMSALPDPLPPPPAALPKPEADTGCPEGTERIAFRLSEQQTLWGICTSAGAYNFFYEFFLAEGDKARPVVFPLPAALGESVNELVNAWLSEDGLSILSFDKARGLGDCGDFSAWAFDGAEFRLVNNAAMGDCRGVLSDDWPVLYRARLQ
jgi:hypothetical protein